MTGSGYRIMLVNSPGGSTLQWDEGRGLPRITNKLITISVAAMLQVSDGWYTATADVTVNIDDVNDNAPQFEQHFYQVGVSNNHDDDDNTVPAWGTQT